jgi:deazaflavin-dependent oxidoreductase (nitroreductase family)
MVEFDDERFRTDSEAITQYNQQIIEEFRANEGRVGGIFENYSVALLTTIGAKSGQARLRPLVCLFLDGRMVVIGSRGGAPSDPAWVHNLRANPKGQLEIGAQRYAVNAREVLGVERDALWEKVVAAAPNFAEYQAKTTRTIPLFELQRA